MNPLHLFAFTTSIILAPDLLKELSKSYYCANLLLYICAKCYLHSTVSHLKGPVLNAYLGRIQQTQVWYNVQHHFTTAMQAAESALKITCFVLYYYWCHDGKKLSLVNKFQFVYILVCRWFVSKTQFLFLHRNTSRKVT